MSQGCRKVWKSGGAMWWASPIWDRDNWSAKNLGAHLAPPVPTPLCPYKLRECPNCRGKMRNPMWLKRPNYFWGANPKKNWPFRAGNFFVFPCEIKTLSKFGPPASLLCNTLSFERIKQWQENTMFFWSCMILFLTTPCLCAWHIS